MSSMPVGLIAVSRLNDLLIQYHRRKKKVAVFRATSLVRVLMLPARNVVVNARTVKLAH